MSILIRGMEMPTLYRTYKVQFAESGDGKIIVGIASEGSTAYRPIGEVISVPPHGRLIDADAELKKLNRICLPDDLSYTIGHDIAKQFLKDAPTIIPAEEESNG